MNTSAIDVDWKKPIYSYVIAGETDYPTTENLIALPTAGIVSTAGPNVRTPS